jgi:hypothetical protein
VEEFYSGPYYFTSAYEESFVEIHVSGTQGILDRSTGVISFDNGLRADFEDGRLEDGHHGLVVWRRERPSVCDLQLSNFWTGRAQIHPLRKAARSARVTRKGTIVLVGHDSPNGGENFGLLLGKPIRVCGKLCHEIASLGGFVACFYRDEMPQFHGLKFNTAKSARDQWKWGDVDNRARGDLQHLDSNLKTHALFEATAREICRIERATLYNKLQAISGAKNSYAVYDMFGGPGYHITTAGPAVAYVTKCVATEVVKVDFPNCTTEVPVHLMEGNHTDKDTLFMDPVTHVLRRFATEVECAPTLPIMWYLEGRWWCATPSLVPCEEPMSLDPTSRGRRKALGET